jgi:hypothetical protein
VSQVRGPLPEPSAAMKRWQEQKRISPLPVWKARALMVWAGAWTGLVLGAIAQGVAR